MLKLVVFIVISVVLAAFAAVQFIGQLEHVSARQSRGNKELKALELGISGRAILALAFAIVMFILALLSRWYVVSTLLALVISVALVLGNAFLKIRGFNVLTAFFCLWIGNLVSSLYQTRLGASDFWGKFFVIFEVIMLVLMVAGTIYGNFLILSRKIRERDAEADELEEERTRYADDEAEQNEAEAKAKAEQKAREEAEAKAKALENGVVYPDYDDDDDDEEDDESEWDEDDLRKEVRLKFIIQTCIIAGVIIAAVALGFWLETKFDFFPPYRL